MLSVALLAMFGACSSPATPPNGPADGGAADAVADASNALAPLARVTTYLQGDFDNAAQVARGFSKLVERHVCKIPNRIGTTSEQYLYVEQVEVKPEGRDAYYTRVVILSPRADGSIVSKIYKLAASHPLTSDAFKYNGPRDGCLKPDVLATIKDTDLVYRDGCDVTFTAAGADKFLAATSGTKCSFPGGYIETTADIFEDGLDTKDQAVSGGSKTGDAFEFRRVLNWTPKP
jgi:hypothetical protein